MGAAGDHWELVLADGRAVASPGTPLGDALRGLVRRGPVICRDAYGRSTGVDVSDPSGDPTSDRRLQVRGARAAGGGALAVRASFYISELEITMATGCHRD